MRLFAFCIFWYRLLRVKTLKHSVFLIPGSLKIKFTLREVEYTKKNGDKAKLAVKIIDRRKAPGDFLHKFLPRELDINLKLDHVNIVKVYHMLELSNKIYIFMEIAEGGDLLEYLKVYRKFVFLFVFWLKLSFYF